MFTTLTTHVILHLLSAEGPLTISNLLLNGTASRPAVWKTVERLRKGGLVRIAGYRGRAKVYEITDSGLVKLTYFDKYDGCTHPLCSCQGNRAE